MSDTSKISSKSLRYPLVIKQVGSDLVITAPDFGIFKSVSLTAESSENSSISSIDLFFGKENQKLLLNALESIWLSIEDHLDNKKWIPDASSFKQTLQDPQEDYSLPEFTKKLNEHISISENTIRREIARGRIRCYQTEGGHRRIPASELQAYLDRSKTSNSNNNSTDTNNHHNKII